MKLNDSGSLDVIVVGAGLAGLVCASQLQRQGLRVRIFDKSGDVGGRLATRRRPEGSWNHGAGSLAASAEEFSQFMHALVDAGAAKQLHARGPEANASSTALFSGVPDLRALLQPLAEQLSINFREPVQALASQGSHWEVRGEHFSTRAAAVVCTAPAPQTAVLLAAGADSDESPASERLKELHQRLSRVRYLPCWTLLLEFDQPVVLPSPSANEVIDLVRPGLATDRGFATHWVIQATSQWSLQHLERSADRSVEQLLAAFCDSAPSAGGQLTWLRSARAHRWRYARCAQPLGAECWWDPRLRLGLAGDWCLEPDAQGAFASASTLVETMTDTWNLPKRAVSAR